MLILGIDPGLGGALAILDCAAKLELLAFLDMPTAGDGAKRRVAAGEVVAFLSRNTRPYAAFVERAQAMPDQGASSGFIYGRSVGAIEATVLCCGIPLFTAEPATWKRHFGLIKCPKDASLELARKLIAGADEALSLKKHHNRAEAMLIAAFGATRRPVSNPAQESRFSGDVAPNVAQG